MENLQELGFVWFSPLVDSKIFYILSGCLVGASLIILCQTIVKVWRNPSILSNQDYQNKTHLAKIYVSHYLSLIGSVVLGVPIRYWFTAKKEKNKDIRTEDQRFRVRAGHSKYISTHKQFHPDLQNYGECTDWKLHIAVHCASYALETSFNGSSFGVYSIDDSRDSWGKPLSSYDLILSYYRIQLSHPSDYYNGVKITPHRRCP